MKAAVHSLLGLALLVPLASTAFELPTFNVEVVFEGNAAELSPKAKQDLQRAAEWWNEQSACHHHPTANAFSDLRDDEVEPLATRTMLRVITVRSYLRDAGIPYVQTSLMFAGGASFKSIGAIGHVAVELHSMPTSNEPCP